MSTQTIPSDADLEAARLLLARLGVTAADLLAANSVPGNVPTFAEYIPRVAEAAPEGAAGVYKHYWNRILQHWPDRHLNEPTPSEIEHFAKTTKNNATVRRNSRGGNGAAEHLIAAFRCIYHHAENDGLINP
ncbi:hypothetical protein, partial [Kribbella solani]|uniref:hypothetical protein n=1 Tax=Kribbella solani TaxID=236067 RepID=UPI0029AEE196